MAQQHQTSPLVSRMRPIRITKSTQSGARSKARLTFQIIRSAPANVSQRPSPQSDLIRTKRKHSDRPVEALQKKSRPLPETHPEAESDSSQYGPEVEWADYYGSWPPVSSDMSPSTECGRSGRPSHSQSQEPCYNQLVRDGEMPAAWTLRHEGKMIETGLVMDVYQTEATISSECQTLCKQLGEADYAPPSGPSFETNRLLKMLRQVGLRNEARIVRDVTPLAVPSPERLDLDGHPGLEHMREALNAEWRHCVTLCGPHPKPDLVVGIASTAFTSEEKQTLRMNQTSIGPNLFPEDMYYPFLVCEVKGGSQSMRKAEQQSMHGASIAVQAIVQLYKRISATDQVDCKILVFSVAHNETEIRIYGHFASIGQERTRFFRREIYAAQFANDIFCGRWYKSSSVIRAIYDTFFSQHLERIRSAIPKLRAPAIELSTSETALDSSSQGTTQKQDLSIAKRAEQEIERLQKENKEMKENQKALMVMMERLIAHQGLSIELPKQSK